jgi:hypothetical protein
LWGRLRPFLPAHNANRSLDALHGLASQPAGKIHHRQDFTLPPQDLLAMLRSVRDMLADRMLDKVHHFVLAHSDTQIGI